MKVLLFANTDWYLYNFLLGLANQLRCSGFDVVMVSPDGPYVHRLRAEGFRWVKLDIRRHSFNPLRDLLLIRQLAKLLRVEAPSLIHNFTLKCIVYGSIAARLAGICPSVNSVAGLGRIPAAASFRGSIVRSLMTTLLRLCFWRATTRLIVQNQDDWVTMLQANVVSTDKIQLIRGSGVDTSRFMPSNRDLHRQTRVLLVARLLWSKGIREYLDAADYLHKKKIGIDFIIAGGVDPGNPGSVSAEDVRNWRRSSAVELLGHVDDITEVLLTVDLVVLPTLYGEGVPRALIEAGACALPVIATDAPGCREIVEPGVNGFLVPARDTRALADAIKLLHDDPALRRRMGQAGRVKVLREFDEKIVFERTLAVYKELLTD